MCHSPLERICYCATLRDDDAALVSPPAAAQVAPDRIDHFKRGALHAMFDLLKSLFAPPPHVTSIDAVRNGKAVVEGILRADGPLLRSPLKNAGCVAYYYRAWYQAPSRGRAAERLLKEAEVYAPRFGIGLEGGPLAVVPARPGMFDLAEHQQLKGSGVQGFRAEEQVIAPGDRVRIHGRVRIEGGAPVLVPDRIEVLESAPEPGGFPRTGRKAAKGSKRS